MVKSLCLWKHNSLTRVVTSQWTFCLHPGKERLLYKEVISKLQLLVFMIMKEFRGWNGILQGSQEQCGKPLVVCFGSSSHNPGVREEKGKVPELRQCLVLCANSVQSQPQPRGGPVLLLLARASPLEEQTSFLSEGSFVLFHFLVKLTQNAQCL